MTPLQILAHPRNLDANGGHYDNSTGEYHYHHGWPAHEHTNGKCPYNFVDNSGQILKIVLIMTLIVIKILHTEMGVHKHTKCLK